MPVSGRSAWRSFVNLEGFGLAPTRPEQAPRRYARWLNELHERPALRPYKDFDAIAERLRRNNPRLTRGKGGVPRAALGSRNGAEGVLRSDPAHKIVNPLLYRYEEVRACWAQVSAPVLWVDAAESDTLKRLGLTEAQHAERRSSFPNLDQVTVARRGPHAAPRPA